MPAMAARNRLKLRWRDRPLMLAVGVLATLLLLMYGGMCFESAQSNPALAVDRMVLFDDSIHHPHARPSASENRPTQRVRQQAHPFAGLQARWDSVWSIDIASAERNEANIDRAVELRVRAVQGDLDAAVELIGAATWCASGGPLVSSRENADGTRPPPCAERFGGDIASRDALEWAIFRWTMMLANAGFREATLYASIRGRDLLFAPSTAVDSEAVEALRSQLIGQLQSMALTGSADAASELNGYYMKAVEAGASGAEEARYYAKLTEALDPARSGSAQVTEDWIATRTRAPG